MVLRKDMKKKDRAKMFKFTLLLYVSITNTQKRSFWFSYNSNAHLVV